MIYFKANSAGSFFMGYSIPWSVIWALQTRSSGKLYWMCGCPTWTWDTDAAGEEHGIRVPVCAVVPMPGPLVSLACSGVLPSVLILLGAHSHPKAPQQSLFASNCFSLMFSTSQHVPAHLLLPMDQGEAGPCLGMQPLWLSRQQHSLSPLQAKALPVHVPICFTAICTSCEISLSWNSSPLPLRLIPTQCIYREQLQSHSARPRLFKPC